MIVIGILVVVVLIIVWAVGTYNGLVKKDLKCDEAFSTMDVYMKKRFDLIPNLVETVKGYAKHEKETLEKVIAARNSVQNAGSTAEKMEAENQISSTLKSIFALAESYPDLKANTNFQTLMGNLEKIEEDIANSRKYYNAVVRDFNVKIRQFPSSIVANFGHFEKKELYEIKSEERENVKVNF